MPRTGATKSDVLSEKSMAETVPYDLTGRGAIITGANQGLGRAIAEHFVRAGADVLLTARDEDLLRQVQREFASLARRGQKVLVLSGDVSIPHSCREVASLARRELPGLAVLVNNAGVYGPKGGIEDLDWDEWVRAIEINLFGTVLM